MRSSAVRRSPVVHYRVLAQSENAIYRGFGNGGTEPVVPPYAVQAPHRAVPQRVVKGLEGTMPFWLKAVLGIIGVFVAVEVIAAIVHAIFGALFFVAIGAGAVALVWYGYHRFMNSLPAYRRRQIRNRRDF